MMNSNGEGTVSKYFVEKKNMRSTKSVILHGLYLFLYGFVKYLPFPLTNLLRYAVLRLFSSRISTTYISEAVHIWFPWNVSIGINSSVNQGVIIDGFAGVTIGDDVRIASNVIINTADHAFENKEIPIRMQGYVCAPVTIEDDVWIGAQAIINKGVKIGKGAVIGAGSVVTKDVPPYMVAVGNPCRVLKARGGA
jgi:acetyltransferase-like isoleucine patch superfamily enzyme